MKKLAVYFLLSLFLYGCSTTKYVSENELLLTKNTIIVDSTSEKTSKLNQYLIQKPNGKALGLPLSLYFYNLGNPYGSKDVTEWKKRHPSWYNSMKSIFSKKQSIAFANTFIGLNNWYLKGGQAPVVINDRKTKKSLQNLKTYFQNNGYFKAKLWSKKDTIGTKKGAISYFIEKGKPLIIDTIHTHIESPVLDSIYKTTKVKSLLTSGQYNNQHFINEAERLNKLFINKGIYQFNINSILFDDVDTSSYKTNVLLKINDRQLEKNNIYYKKPYQIQRIKRINVYTDYSYSKRDSTPKVKEIYNGINFYAFGNKLKYNPKFLSQSIFIKPNQIYIDSLSKLTQSHLRGLNNFKITRLPYKELNDKELEANIILTPIEKYTLGIETELSRSNLRNYDISAKFSILNRNTFRGAEIFKLSLSGSYFNSSKGPGWEFGSDASIEVPRFMAPFGLHKLVPKTMFPKTRFFTGTSIQKNIGLDRQNFNLGIDYKWQYNKRKSIHVELINAQYIKNLNTSQYFNIYKSQYKTLNKIAKIFYNNDNYNLEIPNEAESFMSERVNQEFATSNPKDYTTNLNILNRYQIITSNFLIPVTSYQFTYNNQENYKDQDFSYFRVRIANSGNVIGLLSNELSLRKRKTFFQIPIAQYFKTDIEYKKFWQTSQFSTLGVRVFSGAIFPYGYSDIPFSKSYFAGGSNDIRAWRTYDLGPGRRPPGLEYNIGSFKLLGNIEYRFDMIGSVKGALFLDGGNIWDITNSILVDEDARLNNFKSLLDIAIGTGFGIRYDFKFLILRLDLGLKVREPYLKGKRWFQNTNLSNVVYNIGINYPF